MRQLIIGDIHGCYHELLDLVERAGISSPDEMPAVGDINDRGPDSPAVLDFLQSVPNASSLLGNHERKHVGWWRGRIARRRCPTRSRASSLGRSGIRWHANTSTPCLDIWSFRKRLLFTASANQVYRWRSET